jgi:hypothetical protein
MQPEQSLCFEFWYHMFGPAVPELAVYIKSEEFQEEQDLEKVWQLSGTQSDEWRRGTIPINSDQRFSVVIEANALPNQRRLN